MLLLKRNALYLILPFILCSGCGDAFNVVFEENIRIPHAEWDKKDVLSILMPVEDTVSFYDMQIYIRNRSDYPFSNLYLFISVTAPTGAKVTDTIQYILADDNGEWKGKGFSQLWDNRFSFRNNVRFVASGDYLVQIRHGMRDEDLEGGMLPGITDIGVRLVTPN